MALAATAGLLSGRSHVFFSWSACVASSHQIRKHIDKILRPSAVSDAYQPAIVAAHRSVIKKEKKRNSAVHLVICIFIILHKVSFLFKLAN